MTARDCSAGIGRFADLAEQLVYKWLNRRSQKGSFTWEGFRRYLKHYPLPEPRIVHRLYAPSSDPRGLLKSRMREIGQQGRGAHKPKASHIARIPGASSMRDNDESLGEEAEKTRILRLHQEIASPSF